MSMDNIILFEYANKILKAGEMPSINIVVQEEVPPELIAKMKALGIDTSKLKIKQDAKDAQVKAHNLFKKATNAITFANALGKSSKNTAAIKAQANASITTPKPVVKAASNPVRQEPRMSQPLKADHESLTKQLT